MAISSQYKYSLMKLKSIDFCMWSERVHTTASARITVERPQLKNALHSTVMG